MKLTCIIGIILIAPLLGYANTDDFVPLIGIPGLTAGDYTINTYIDALYVLTISLAAFLVVVQLILAGFQYMLTDVVPQKEQAKTSIRNSFLGLGVILGAVLILNTINPQLTQLNALNIEPVVTTITTPYAEPASPTRDTPLEPYEDESMTRIACADWDDGGGCTSELDSCFSDLNGNPRSRSFDGYVLCYVDTESESASGINASNCEGFFEPQRGICYADNAEQCSGFFDTDNNRCYPAEDRVELGADFINQPARVRQPECQNIGGIYNDPYCYLR